MKVFTKPSLARLQKALSIITEEANGITRKINEHQTREPKGAINRDLHRWELDRLTNLENYIDEARRRLKDVINGGKA